VSNYNATLSNPGLIASRFGHYTSWLTSRLRPIGHPSIFTPKPITSFTNFQSPYVRSLIRSLPRSLIRSLPRSLIRSLPRSQYLVIQEPLHLAASWSTLVYDPSVTRQSLLRSPSPRSRIFSHLTYVHLFVHCLVHNILSSRNRYI
jgi:hypothetical protein